MKKTIMIILALVAMNLTDVEAKKFYHYGNTLTFLCDDETMTAEVAGTYHVETSGTITVPETFVAKDGNTYTVTAIGDDFLCFHDFSYSQNCSEVVLPKTIKSIGKRAFGYSNIQRINLPEGLETIDDEAFLDCSSLELAELPSTVKHLGNKAFDKCGSITISALPESIETLGSSALEEIDFPETLECIGNWVFRGTSLKKADLSHTSLRNIIWEAFADNASLTEVRLPATCNFVGAKAFAGCDNICVVEVLATEPPTAEAEAFQSPVTEQATLIVPEGSEQAYRNAEVWKEFKNIATPTSLRTTIVDSQEDERIYDLRGIEKQSEKGLVIKNGIKVIKN